MAVALSSMAVISSYFSSTQRICTNLVVLIVAITIATMLSIVATVMAVKAVIPCWFFLLRHCAPFWYLGWLLLLDIEWGKTTN